MDRRLNRRLRSQRPALCWVGVRSFRNASQLVQRIRNYGGDKLPSGYEANREFMKSVQFDNFLETRE